MEILLLYFGTWSVIYAALRVHPLRFDFAVTLVWLASVLLNWFPPLVAGSSLSFTTVAMIVSAHVLLVGGFNLTGGPQLRLPSVELPQETSAAVVRALASASFVMCAGTVVSAILAGSLPILGALEHVQTYRMAFFEGSLELTALEQLTQWLKYPAFVFVALLPSFIRRRDHLMTGLAIATALSIADAGLRLGARADITFTALVIAGAWIAVYGITSGRGLVIAGVASVLFFLLGGSFILARNQDFRDNQRFFISRVCGIEEGGPWLAGEASPESGALALSLCYFASPLHAMDRFISDNERTWIHTYGAYNLGFVFRHTFDDSRREIAGYFARSNLGTNPWATSVRDFWLDFGLMAPLAFLPLGLMIGWFSPKPGQSGELAIARAGLLVPWAVMIPFISPLIVRSLVYPLVIVAMWALAARLNVVLASRQRGLARVRSSASAGRARRPPLFEPGLPPRIRT